MIAGIGIDAVDIGRFNHWYSYSTAKLLRVFTPDEISYCLKTPTKTAERFAARFAAKEAFYKALSSAYPDLNVSLLAILKIINVSTCDSGKPELHILWDTLSITPLKCFISLTHTATTATALVILERYPV